MLKVLQVISSLSSGGAEVFVSQLSVALAKHCDVKVVTYAGELDNKGVSLKEYLLKNNVEYESMNAVNYISRFMVPFWYAKVIREWKPDIIHVHLTRSEQFVYLASYIHGLNIPAIRTKHDEKDYPYSILNKGINNYFSFNIACSGSSLVPLSNIGLANKSEVINNGIEIRLNNLCDHGGAKSFKDSVGLPADKYILLNIGRMYETPGQGYQKSQDLIIKALSLSPLKDKLHVVFLGDGVDKNKLMDMARELYVKDRVSFMGVVSNTYDFMNCADVLVMPSRWEGLPISALEAACYGMPMVVSNIDSFMNFNTDNVIRCAPESVDSLVNAISDSIMRLDTLKEASKVASSVYRNMYSMDNVSIKHIELYKKIVSVSN